MGMPYPGVLQFIGQELLYDEVAGIIVCVLIPIAIAQLRHQFARCIAQMQWNRLVARLTLPQS